MDFKKILLVTLLLNFCFLKIISQGFSWERYTTKDGLLSNSVNEIVQDYKGYLWLQNGNGFTRFDGLKFTSYIDKSSKQFMYGASDITPQKNGAIYFNLDFAIGILQNGSSFSYFWNDSSLTREYHPDKGAYKRFQPMLNQLGYRVFGKDRSYSVNIKRSDTLFYQKEGEINWVILPTKYKKESNFLKQDHAKNIYVLMLDTIHKKQIYFLFDNGKLIESANSKIFHGDPMPDKKNNFWITDYKTAECFSGGKLIKRYYLKDTIDGEISLPQIDSKNNLWLSTYRGLIKLNANEIKYFYDLNRHVQRNAENSFDANGVEQINYIESHRNFLQAFAIDKYDNVITGERFFDGFQFTNISSGKEFTDLFENSKRENLPQINTCYVDNENNVWYGTSIGLFKASPIPFKGTDKFLSFEEADYLFMASDLFGRKYYFKNDIDNNKLSLKVMRGDSLLFFKKMSKLKNSPLLNCVVFGNGILYTYEDSYHMENLIYYDGTKETLLKDKIDGGGNGTLFKSIFFNKKRDTALFSKPNNLILITKTKFSNLSYPKALKSRLGYANKHGFSSILLNDLTGIRIKSDFSIDTFNFHGLSKLLPDYKFAIIGKMEDESKKIYIDVFKNIFLISDLDKLTKLNLKINDSIFKKCISDLSENAYYFRDLLIINSWRYGSLIFKIENNSIEYLRCLTYSDGLPDHTGNEYFYDNGSVYMWNEWSDGFSESKIINYEDFLAGDLTKAFIIKGLKIGSGVKIRMNEYGQKTINGFICYLGEKGINKMPPPINFTSLTYYDGKGLLHEFSSNAKNAELSYNVHDIYAEFEGICLTDGSKLKYKTRLVGLNNNWEERTSEFKYVRYPTLNPGSYTFQVTACNNNGIWNDSPAEFSFTILPPWYRTWYAYACYVLAFFAAIRGYIRNRTKKLEKEKNKLEQTVQERTAEVNEQKHLLEVKNKEIIDSITYAKRIQQSLLPTEKYIERVLNKDHKKKD